MLINEMRADRACPELLKQLSKRGKPDFGIGCPCGNKLLNTPTQGMGCFRANAYDKVARPDNTGNAYNANMNNGNITTTIRLTPTMCAVFAQKIKIYLALKACIKLISIAEKTREAL